MPTYEYKCAGCGHQFEKFSTRITHESSVECPRCGGLAERLISGGAGLLFKGSGFYITDYRSDSYKKEQKKEGKPSDSAAPAEAPKSSSEKTSEKKSEKKESK